MTAVDFAVRRPRTVAEAVAALGELAPDAVLLAGGGSLGILLSERAARPDHVIDLNEVAELAGIEDAGERVRIGAMTRVHDIEHSPLLAKRLPLLVACARTIADPSLRHRVTLGGGLGYADPSGSLATALLALGAEIGISGPRGDRSVDIDELFVGCHETALAPDELITHALIDVPPRAAGAHWIDLDRRHLAYSIVSAAAVVRTAGGRFESVRVALAGVAPTPRRMLAVERALEGAPTDDATIAAAAAAASDDVDPPDDLHGSAGYRRRVASELAARALAGARDRGEQ
jgi:carbon-monoxide dehydrogenase medium subunit